MPLQNQEEVLLLNLEKMTLYQELDTVTVQCLPASIPTTIEVDTVILIEPDQVLRVKDIVLDEDTTVLNDPEVVVARIAMRAAAKAEEEVVGERISAEEAREAAPSTEAEAK